MLSLAGQWIGDAWFFVHDGRVHGFFLTQSDAMPTEETGRHTEIGHAISDDLTHWEYVGLALQRGAADEWDGQRLCTGSVIERDGRFWMAYAGVAKGARRERQVFRTGMACSDDLYRWTKHEGNPATELDPRLYEEVGTGRRAYGHWRDPFLLDAGDKVHQFVCARRKSDDPNRRGTVGLASTTDMLTWKIAEPLEVDEVAEELQVPQVHEIDGLYYLLFCTSPDLLLPAFKQRYPHHDFRAGDFSMVGVSPFGPFRIHGTGEVVPGDAPVVPYASQLVTWNDEWFSLGTIRAEASPNGLGAIGDPLPITADGTGIHAVVK